MFNSLVKARKPLLFLGLLLVLGIARCTLLPDSNPSLVLPEHFPNPIFPTDNPFMEERVALGKKLFFDPILSRDSSMSCAFCHRPELAFSDHVAISSGVNGPTGFRNSPSLANVAYDSLLFWDGGAPSLELQMLAPMESEDELHLDINEVVARLKQEPEYSALFQKVFGKDPDPFGVTRSIASFQRTLISGDSPYDKYVLGEESALNAAEKRGLALFESDRLACSSCHSGFRFSNGLLENNGLHAVPKDRGRARITHDSADVGFFKVPSLRNIAVTGPYMHDGSLHSLKGVIAHYAKGGNHHSLQSPKLSGFELSDKEEADLLAFLKSLTDKTFINNPAHRP